LPLPFQNRDFEPNPNPQNAWRRSRDALPGFIRPFVHFGEIRISGLTAADRREMLSQDVSQAGPARAR